MEKTLSMGAFTELDEREVMETEGGSLLGWIVGASVVGLVGGGVACFVEGNKANNAEKTAKSMCNDYYEYVKMNGATVPLSAIETANQYANEYGWKPLA